MHRPSTATPLADWLARILEGVRQKLARGVARLRAPTPHFLAVIALLHTRLNRAVQHIDRLAHLFAAGRLPAPRPPRPARKSPAVPRPPGLRLPQGRAWLLRIDQSIAQHISQIQAFLDAPDTIALLRAAPQAARHLRPLCRAIGVPLPDHLRLPPPAPRPPRTQSPRAKRPKLPGPLRFQDYRPGHTRPPFPLHRRPKPA
jgi:hypothetical protein